MKERSQAKRDALIEAAIDEFAAHGLAGAKMDAIAARAQASKRTLYKYFANKEALYETVVDRLLAHIEPIAAHRYDPNRGLDQQLRDIALCELALLGDPAFLRLSRIVLIESMRAVTEAERLMRKFTRVESQLHGWFHGAAAAGALGDLPATLAADLFFGALKELAYWKPVLVWQRQPDAETRVVIVEQVCRLLLARIASTRP